MTLRTKQIRVLGGALLLVASAGAGFLPFVVHSQGFGGGSMSVPVNDSEHIQVSEESRDLLKDILKVNRNHLDTSTDNLEQNRRTVDLLERLIQKELKDDPSDEAQAKEALGKRSVESVRDVLGGYKGYMNNAYLPQYNNCAEGSNSYIEVDPQQYYRDVSDSQFNRFLVEKFDYSQDDLCAQNDNYVQPSSAPPYQKGLVRSLRLGHDRESEFTTPSENYTLEMETGGSAELFMKGDFSQGGYTGLFALFKNPDNHIYGAYTRSKLEIAKREREAKEIEQQKLSWSGGVHAQTDKDNKIKTPGTVNKDRYDRAISFCERSLVQFDEHGRNTTKEGGEDLVKEIDEKCQEIDKAQKEGNALDSDVMGGLFDSLIESLSNYNLDKAFDALIEELEKEAVSYVESVIDGFISSFSSGGFSGGGFSNPF